MNGFIPNPVMPGRKRAGKAVPPAKQWKDSIPFVTFDKGHFEVSEEAVEFLTDLGSLPLAVVALAGPYRHGKSFLLNRVILQHPPGTGFPVGQTVNACTKGLHISTKLLNMSNATDGDYAILVIDTEGLGAMSATDTHDARIFSLALLLSSLFMYNSKGTIDQPAINNLSLVANISEHIRTSSDGNDDIGDFLPSFMWVVRDFALELVDASNREITESEYLENALRPVPDAPPEKNKVRNSLRNYFKHRDCLTMMRPCDDALIKALNDQPESALYPKFREQAAKLREKLEKLARPKQACGTRITGALLARLATIYCEAINSGAAPAIQDSWSLISADECNKAYRAAQDCFDKLVAAKTEVVDREGNRVAVPANILEKLFSEAFKSALERYDKEAIGDKAGEFRERLRDELRNKANRTREANLEIIGKKAENACGTLDDTLLEHDAFDGVRKKYSELEGTFYKEVGVDSACRSVWATTAVRRVWDWSSRFYGQLETRCVAAETKVASLEKAEAKAAEHEAKVLNEVDTLRQRVKTLEAQNSDAMGELADAKAQAIKMKGEMDQALDDAEETEAKHRDQLQRLQEELSQSTHRADTAERAASDAAAKLAKVAEQLSDKETELLAIQAELEELRAQQRSFAEREHEVLKLTESNQALQRKTTDLTKLLDRNAEENRSQMETLVSETQRSMKALRDAKENAEKKQAQSIQEFKELKEASKRDKEKYVSENKEMKRVHEKLSKELTKLSDKHEKEVEKNKAEIAELRAEMSASAKKFQAQLEENSTQHREELRKRNAKSREEMDALFQDKMTASSRAQTAESRAEHAEAALKEAREELAKERDRFREQNFPAQLSELRSKLSTAENKAEMMQTSLRERGDTVDKQQSRIIELEDELRQIHQRHEAEKVQMLCDHASQLGTKPQ